MPGIFVQASAEQNLFGLCRVQPKISKKWQYATGHAPSIPPPCISANSCDRPGRHLSIATIRVNSCNSWAKKIFPNNSWAIIFRGISVAPKTTSSCPKLFPLSSYIPPHCISANSCDRPGRHLIHCNYSCQFVQFVGKKKIPIIRGQ